ncbi:MAG: hypothetical protein JW730_04955 [Anaerolineales bacterium]|nr:hypothetical protein [Anaerolineales bacterium]
MNTNRDNSFLFASETTIFRIVSISKIVSWIMLVFFLIIFVVNSLLPIMNGQANWPRELPQLMLSVVDLFYAPMLGLFYFLVLQGVAHGLNLGLDIYYDFQPEEDEEEVDEEI